MTKEQFDGIMAKIHSMSIEELEKTAIEIFEESGIEWTYGDEGIEFDELPFKENKYDRDY